MSEHARSAAIIHAARYLLQVDGGDGAAQFDAIRLADARLALRAALDGKLQESARLLRATQALDRWVKRTAQISDLDSLIDEVEAARTQARASLDDPDRDARTPIESPT